MIIFSFSFWFLPIDKFTQALANFIFSIGYIIFFDFLSYEFSGFSLLHSNHGGKFHILLIGWAVGLFLEFYFDWIGKYWYYPKADTTFYLLILSAFPFYFMYILETYLGSKAMFEHFFVKRKRRLDFSGLKKFFISIGLIGTIGLSVSTTLILLQLPYSTLNGFFSVNRELPVSPSLFWYMTLTSFSLWLLLEFLEYERHETSLLLETIRGKPWPLLSTLIAGWIAGTIYEGFNVPIEIWRYANVPFMNLMLFGIPLAVLIVWPVQYLAFISMYRLLFKKETEKIWE